MWTIAFVLVGLIGVVRVASTWHTFSEVLDEPAHIACGYDWLAGRFYSDDPAHPPLARVLSAIPAYVRHAVVPADAGYVKRGNAILYGGHYIENLARARSANLLFLIIGMATCAVWATALFNRGTGLLAMAMFVSLPPVLGHAGVATTDMAAGATLPLALLLFERWLDAPTIGRGAWLGLGLAVGLLSKFSFLIFFPVSAIVLLAVRLAQKRVRANIRSAAIAVVVTLFVVWGGYRFEFGTLQQATRFGAYVVTEVSPPALKTTANWFARTVPVPAPLFVVGAAAVKLLDLRGHLNYLFGNVNPRGWWYYFPVVFFFKTPIAFLILSLVGLAVIVRRDRRALGVALVPFAIMISVMGSSINIGVRHLLPLYAPLCVVAAHGALTLWRDAGSRAGTAALLAWLFAGVALAHPDYLAWFNEAAGTHPEQIVADSNLDWGQDVLRLARVVRDRKIGELRMLYTGNAVLKEHAIVSVRVVPWTPAPGWYAMSLTQLTVDPDARQGGYRWLDDYHYDMVGKSIRLYHVPELPGR